MALTSPVVCRCPDGPSTTHGGALRRAERLALTHPARPGRSTRNIREDATHEPPEVPSVGLTSPFDEVDRHGKRNRLHSSSVRAPSLRGPPTGLVKVPGMLHPRYPAELRTPKDPRLARQMPLTNHLQPTSCHVHPTGHPDPRREGSHLPDLRSAI